MKRLISAILLIPSLTLVFAPSASTASSASSASQQSAAEEAANPTFTAMTYNIAGGKPGPIPELDWENRKTQVVDLIKSKNPDVFGLQEISGKTGPAGAHTKYWLLPQLSEQYDYFEPVTPHGAPKVVFFRKGRFEVVKNADGTPKAGYTEFANLGGTCTEDFTRTMGWVMLKDLQANRNLFVANLHLAVLGNCRETRIASIPKIHATLKAQNPNNEPMIVFGDYNQRSQFCVGATEGKALADLTKPASADQNYHLMASQSLQVCNSRTHNSATAWAAGDASSTTDHAVDHMFANVGHLRKLSHTVDRVRTVPIPGGKLATPSDHYPVTVKYEYETRGETTLPTHKLGDNANAVKTAAYLLNHHGYVVTVGSSFTTDMQTKLKSFQTAKGVSATGVLDAATWAKLLPSVAPNSTGNAVKALQSELTTSGAFIEVDGSFGPLTQSAVASYQRAASITAETTVTARTWGSLID